MFHKVIRRLLGSLGVDREELQWKIWCLYRKMCYMDCISPRSLFDGLPTSSLVHLWWVTDMVERKVHCSFVARHGSSLINKFLKELPLNSQYQPVPVL
jgi:hypothetical protein